MKLAIYDLGGQYCHMIQRRYRDQGIEADIVAPGIPAAELRSYSGIILSGGPQSIYAENAPVVDPDILTLGIPILGICYGHQLLAGMLGATVAPAEPEFGHTTAVILDRGCRLLDGLPEVQTVWMSHNDAVVEIPAGLRILAHTANCLVAAFADQNWEKFYGVQFHPEVSHTPNGDTVLLNFANICGVRSNKIADRVPPLLDKIKTQVGNRKLFFFVSGGVDSTVAFALCAALLPPDQLTGIYVDTGLMRLHETEELQEAFADLGFADRLIVRDEAERFLGALQGVYDPEEKRAIIGKTFVDVQAEVIAGLGLQDGALLGQGTIYPDVIESGKGTAATIKTHHNQCPEVKAMIEAGLVIEPIREFYKDEVREIGLALGLPRRFVDRWPFPGPGLAIRCLCSPITVHNESPNVTMIHGDYEIHRVPLRSVGVQGDARTYRSTLAARGSLVYEDLVALAHIFHQDRIIVLIDGPDAPLSMSYIRRALITPERISLLQRVDHLVSTRIRDWGLTDTVWQFPVVLLPLSFVDGESIVLRPVNSTDGMTANFHCFNHHILQELAAEIRATIPGIEAVFLDASDKPPATIEWE